MLALDDRVINLNVTTAGAYKYAKVGVSIEMRPSTVGFYDLHGAARTTKESDGAREVRGHGAAAARRPRLDGLVARLRGPDLDRTAGPSSRPSCSSPFRKILGPEEVIDVYFTDFVMQ